MRQDGYYWIKLTSVHAWEVALYMKAPDTFLRIADLRAYSYQDLYDVNEDRQFTPDEMEAMAT
jgi:hypothetical protein